MCHILRVYLIFTWLSHKNDKSKLVLSPFFNGKTWLGKLNDFLSFLQVLIVVLQF